VSVNGECDTFTVVGRGWHGLARRRLVVAADEGDAVAAFREDYPHCEVVAVIAGSEGLQ
jgi:hypothetical protein